MATYTANIAKSITTVAAQVDTITLSGTGKVLSIIDKTGTTNTFFTTATVGGTPETPTVLGDDCYCVPVGKEFFLPWIGTGIVIKLINSGISTLTFQLL